MLAAKLGQDSASHQRARGPLARRHYCAATAIGARA